MNGAAAGRRHVAAVTGGRRHLWVRFRRSSWAGDGAHGAALQLEPMMKDELISAIFLDSDLGPTAAEVRAAVERAHGWPGPAIAALAGRHPGRARMGS